MLLGPIPLLDIMQSIRDSTSARGLRQICYMQDNTRRDTAAEKEFHLVIQMTLEHVLVQRFKEKELTNIKQRHVNFTKRANSSKIII